MGTERREFVPRYPVAFHEFPHEILGGAHPQLVYAVQPGRVFETLHHVFPQLVPQPLIFFVREIHPLPRKLAEGFHGVIPAHVHFGPGGFGLEFKRCAQRVQGLDVNDVPFGVDILGPVSYTHLDVYKRQSPPCGFWAVPVSAPR